MQKRKPIANTNSIASHQTVQTVNKVQTLPTIIEEPKLQTKNTEIKSDTLDGQTAQSTKNAAHSEQQPAAVVKPRKLSICNKVIVESICFYNNTKPSEQKGKVERTKQKKYEKKAQYVVESSDSEQIPEYEHARRHYKYREYNRPKRYRRRIII